MKKFDKETQLRVDKQRAYLGLDYRYDDLDRIIVTQIELKNGWILNQSQLIERARKIFPNEKIVPNVFSLNTDLIDLDWIKNKMNEFGIKQKDIVKHLSVSKSELSRIITGSTGLSNRTKASFYFYFLTFELNKSFREYLESTEN